MRINEGMEIRVGRYVNPGNEGFAEILRSRYVDKTGLISVFDSSVDTSEGLVMVSRPRRFGKSYAAQALAAFHSRACDSRALFASATRPRSSTTTSGPCARW